MVYPKQEQKLWAEAIVGLSQGSAKTTETLSQKTNSSTDNEKIDGLEVTSPNKTTSKNRFVENK
tara:strand:- start:115 stop:306 length:192 start_codon:yes stop_codon:yes gene_type:complete